MLTTTKELGCAAKLAPALRAMARCNARSPFLIEYFFIALIDARILSPGPILGRHRRRQRLLLWHGVAVRKTAGGIIA